MRISNGVEWALHCCVVLSQASAPVPAAQLAAFHEVSPSYLAKHLQALSRAGLTRSTQGAVGGYELVRETATSRRSGAPRSGSAARSPRHRRPACAPARWPG